MDAKAAGRQPFWQRQDFDHRAIVTATAQWKTLPRRTRYDAVAALLWTAHDAVLRQDERQHFECYVAIAHGARVQYARAPAADVSAWRLEAHLFADWLKTDYRMLEYSETVLKLRRLTEGPRAPWLKVQTTLPLSDASRLAELKGVREQRGYWAAHQLSERHPVRRLKYTPR